MTEQMEHTGDPGADDTVAVGRVGRVGRVGDVGAAADDSVDDDTLSAPRSGGVSRPGGAAEHSADLDDETVVVARPPAFETDDATVAVPGGREPSVPAAAPETMPVTMPAAAVAPAIEDQEARPWRGGALPQVYGPRSIGQAGERAGLDEVQRRIGAPPEAGADPLPERALLPSLAKRARRSAIITISAYAATVALSLLGLWVVARLALS